MSLKRTQSLAQQLCRHTESRPPRGNKVRDLAPDTGLCQHRPTVLAYGLYQVLFRIWSKRELRPFSLPASCGHSAVSQTSRETTVHKSRASVGSISQSVAWNTWNFPSGCVLGGHHRRRNSHPTGRSIYSRRPWAEAQRNLVTLRPVELQSTQLLGSCGPPVRHHGGHSHQLALRGLDVERTLYCL